MHNEFKIKKEDIIKLTDLKGSCIASNKITIEGKKINYMYREQPTNDTDSGWRFFAGDEDEEYTNNPDNFHIFALNTICNYDEAIIPYLEYPINSVLSKSAANKFILEK